MMAWPTNLVLLLISLPISFQQSCESFSGVKVHDYALLSYSFAFYNTGDSFSCAHRCLSRDQCKSYNYALFGAQQGLCELNSAGRDASNPLQYRPGFVFVEAVLKQKKHKSCFDYWKDGTRISGAYRIQEDGNNPFDVYCDFGSESHWVWTLVMSQSHKNRAMEELRRIPFCGNAPLNEYRPNWKAYRLSLDKMKHLQSQSTHWRITCSSPTHSVNYTDYVRANFTEFDLLSFEGQNVCKKVEYMNVRGHGCKECTSAWWQESSSWSLHHDSATTSCEFGSTAGFVDSEDNFGFYVSTNPKFRCSSSSDTTTNHWFGIRV